MKRLTLCFAVLLSGIPTGCTPRPAHSRVNALIDKACIVGPVRGEECDPGTDPPACKRVIFNLKKQCVELSIAK